MIKRLILMLLVVVTVCAGVIGWFGYAAYTWVTDAIAYRDRLAEVAQSWPQLPAEPMTGHGVQPFTMAKATGRTLTVMHSVSSCRPRALVADVDQTAGYVAVLLHSEQPWLPPIGEWWNAVESLLPGRGCAATLMIVPLTITLDAPRAGRPVIDAVGGRIVIPAK